MKQRIKIQAWRATFNFNENPLNEGLSFIQTFYHFREDEQPFLEFNEERLIPQKHYKATLVHPNGRKEKLIVCYFGFDHDGNEVEFGLDSKDHTAYSFNFSSFLKFEKIE